MKKTLVVAKWEYLEKVKSKAFIIGLFLTPMIMIGMGILPGLLAGQEDKETKVLGVIDLSGEIGSKFAERMQEGYKFSSGIPRYLVQVLASGQDVAVDEVRSIADSRVMRNELEGYCVISTNLNAENVFEYRSKNVGDFRITKRIEETLSGILRERKAIALGIDTMLLSELNVPIDLRAVKLSDRGEEEGSGFLEMFFTAYIFLMMLFFLIFTSGQLLVRSVIEEKSNRIVEILVSSCSPTELMAGKVLGLSALGFTQIGFWGLVGVAGSLKFNLTLVQPDQALLLLVYFVLGYLFYASVFIALGSPVTTEQEAQQISSYLVLFLIVPIVIAIPAIQNPDATWLKVLTFIPLLTPTIMALRIPIQTPSLWEVSATIVLLGLSIYGGMWVAGRIFRIAILATGKRPGLAEVIRWVKTG